MKYIIFLLLISIIYSQHCDYQNTCTDSQECALISEWSLKTYSNYKMETACVDSTMCNDTSLDGNYVKIYTCNYTNFCLVDSDCSGIGDNYYCGYIVYGSDRYHTCIQKEICEAYTYVNVSETADANLTYHIQCIYNCASVAECANCGMKFSFDFQENGINRTTLECIDSDKCDSFYNYSGSQISTSCSSQGECTIDSDCQEVLGNNFYCIGMNLYGQMAGQCLPKDYCSLDYIKFGNTEIDLDCYDPVNCRNNNDCLIQYSNYSTGMCCGILDHNYENLTEVACFEQQLNNQVHYINNQSFSFQCYSFTILIKIGLLSFLALY